MRSGRAKLLADWFIILYLTLKKTNRNTVLYINGVDPYPDPIESEILEARKGKQTYISAKPSTLFTACLVH
jgi:hypothetical protein